MCKWCQHKKMVEKRTLDCELMQKNLDFPCLHIETDALFSTNSKLLESSYVAMNEMCHADRKDWIFPCLATSLPFGRREIQSWFGGSTPAQRSALPFSSLWGGFCVSLCTFLYSPFDIITVGFSNLVKYFYFYQRYLIFFFMTT